MAVLSGLQSDRVAANAGKGGEECFHRAFGCWVACQDSWACGSNVRKNQGRQLWRLLDSVSMFTTWVLALLTSVCVNAHSRSSSLPSPSPVPPAVAAAVFAAVVGLRNLSLFSACPNSGCATFAPLRAQYADYRLPVHGNCQSRTSHRQPFA